MKGLTKRQKEVLNFIEQYQKENGISPSIRDMGNYFDFSVRAGHDHLIALEKKGYIFRVSGKSRNIIINYDDIKNIEVSKSVDNFNKLSKTSSLMSDIPRAKECYICGSKENVHRHHEDYDKPKQYIELCRKHHLSWHVFKRGFKKKGLNLVIPVK